MDPLFLALSPLMFGVVVMIGVLISTVIREVNPYLHFKMHVFFVKLGLYRVKRNSRYFEVITGFDTEVRFEKDGYMYSQPDKQIDKLQVTTPFKYSALEFNYCTKTKQITKFTCSETFAKKMKTEKFKKLLETYLSRVIEKEHGKPSEKQKAEEAMKDVTLFSTPSVKTPSKKETKACTTAWNDYYFSSVVRYELASIQEKKDALKEHIHSLDVEEKHAYEQLIHTRIPNLLKQFDEFDSNTQNKKEKEMRATLQIIQKTMDAWLLKIQAQSHSDFEKERILIKELAK